MRFASSEHLLRQQPPPPRLSRSIIQGCLLISLLKPLIPTLSVNSEVPVSSVH